ncbi:MAG: rubrerythrin family protein [Candidatus Atribacteria bacterium]|nr:rubrerythrin family protein [Candidatus Atribacteria bacterium]
MDYRFSDRELAELKKAQQDELVGQQVYGKLAELTKDPHNSKILAKIANDEKEHAKVFRKYTQTDLKVDRFKVFFYVFVARAFGLTFSIKLQEKGEAATQKKYKQMFNAVPEIKKIIEDEEKHEAELINMINEEKLSYMSSIVLGLNDALVELTGALAGFTLSIRNSRIIALLGLITGISASLSMAASEYLSNKADPDPENREKAKRSALYTGTAYILTVIALVTPYFLYKNYLFSFTMTIAVALFIIFVFNYYISVVNDYDFKKRFLEMASISIGVAALSSLIGFLVKTFLGFEL